MLYLLALAVRLIDLTEPPLDYQPTRQLHGALISRAIFYKLQPDAESGQIELAVDAARSEVQYEPPILETLVAMTYWLVGGEQLWVARLWSIFFWLVGGLFVFALAKRLVSTDAAVISLAYYLFLPLGVTVSRSFQPDSLMVALLVASAFLLVVWSDKHSWRWAIAGGLACGLTVLVKGRPAPIVGAMLIGVMLAQGNLRDTIRDGQAWVILVLSAAFPFAYYLGLSGPGTLTQVGEFSTGVAGLLLERTFYARWLIFVDDIVFLGVAVLGVIGLPLLPRIGRGLMLGLSIGYLLYGLALPYNIYTHDYYNLPLVPIVAVSIAPVAGVLLDRLSRLIPRWKLFVVGTGLFLLGYQAWLARTAILATDYYAESLGWVKMGRELPSEGSIIGLTHDYGTRIAYYGWRRVGVWPTSQDRVLFEIQGRGPSADIDEEFSVRTAGYDYFLVTLFGEFERQAELKAKLTEEYPLAIDGDGYLLFALSNTE